MILDTLEAAPAYRHLGPGFAAGLDWLATFSPHLADGRYAICGDDVYALVQSYDTVQASDKRYESHRLFADIQYVAEGTEVIQYAPVATLHPVTEYNAENDFLLHADPPASTALLLAPGSFAVFYPRDAHKPGTVHGVADRIRKVVVKVRI